MTATQHLSPPVDDGQILVHVLGAGSGWPTAARDTSGLLLADANGWSLVECPGSIVQKLERLGLSPQMLNRVVLSHDHVDHVYGLPHLLQAMAIAGKPDAVELWAPRQTLDTVRDVVRAYRVDGDGYPTLQTHEIDLRPGKRFRFSDGAFEALPSAHSRETAALRFGSEAGAVCYSSDTRPSDEVARLATKVDVLLHDCGGPHRSREGFSKGHSSALEAAEVASRAGVRRLVLMHLGARSDEELEACLGEAQAAFVGPVSLARDGATWMIPPGPGEARQTVEKVRP